MNCWEKLHQGTADEVDEMMCAARTAGAMEQVDKACLGFTEKVNSLIKEYQEECRFAEFNMLFFVTDQRAGDKPLISFVYGTKGELQKLCTQVQEAVNA